MARNANPRSWQVVSLDEIKEVHDAFCSFENLLFYFNRADPDRIELSDAETAKLYWTEVSSRPLLEFVAGVFRVIDYESDGTIAVIADTEDPDTVFLSIHCGLAWRLPSRKEPV